MENDFIDDIAENLFNVLPVIYKKLLRTDLQSVSSSLSRPHVTVMGMLEEEKLPISEIARRMLVPKSQMTRLVDQLVSLDIVARQPDKKDRRVINISLTDNGESVLIECRELIRHNIRDRISHLTAAELGSLSKALSKLKAIEVKLE